MIINYDMTCKHSNHRHASSTVMELTV